MSAAALVETIGGWIDHRIMRGGVKGAVPIIGLAGCQGSGKSTLARGLAERFGAATLSLDDVYLTKAERAEMARAVHPLFATRGPPGTHDLALLHAVLNRLTTGGPDDRTPLPRFDKMADDRVAEAVWPVVTGRPRAVVLEGWCLGAMPQAPAALAKPVNGLERETDPDGVWRRAVNAALARDYGGVTGRLDALIFLKAPGFDVVLDWRCEQEAELTGQPVSGARRDQLGRFVQHYERLTRHMLDGGIAPDFTVRLNAHRGIVAAVSDVEHP
ncbi:nucleoside triphosphate hydrolase domain-containing protein [Brevundimonas sp. SH203]|uniref:kinase n=1 Tax=Brevundimonas sp. SH203 TaxID=345167 RepID=UPI0009C64E9F|nr:kinase [Brevundimonas sp. SH203]GAW42389.1 nucleoside triphosphate hydrolase domain-containing protein [Brevundimonas sp. SH203]